MSIGYLDILSLVTIPDFIWVDCVFVFDLYVFFMYSEYIYLVE